MASAAVAVQKIIPTVETAEIAPFDHWSRLFSKPFVYEKSFEDSKWDPILVLHSSGSTGKMPSPPRQTIKAHGFLQAYLSQSL